MNNLILLMAMTLSVSAASAKVLKSDVEFRDSKSTAGIHLVNGKPTEVSEDTLTLISELTSSLKTTCEAYSKGTVLRLATPQMLLVMPNEETRNGKITVSMSVVCHIEAEVSDFTFGH